MNSLADAAVAAIVYLSTAQPENDDRADDDIRALESLETSLRQCSPAERKALRAAVKRARAKAEASESAQEVFDALRVIEEDILDAEAE